MITPSAALPSSLRPSFRAPLLLCGILFILYFISLGHPFLFDEQVIIVQNPLIKDLRLVPQLFGQSYFYFDGRIELWNQYYRPLTAATFAIDYSFWKLNSLGYNLTNLFLHGLVVVLLYRFLLKVFGDDRTAFLSALLYAVHTAHTEAVTYTASRGDLLSTVFILIAIHAYWQRKLAGSVFCYLLALLSKESAILLPAYVFLADWCFIRTKPKTLFKNMVIFGGVAIAFLVYRRFFSPVPLGPPDYDWESTPLRFFSMGPAFLSYLQAFVLPETFKFCMSVKFALNFKDPVIFLTGFMVALFAAALFLAAQYRGAALFGIGFFLVGFIPGLQIVHFRPEWAEHYLYLPSIGIAFLVGCLIRSVFESRSKTLLAVFFAVYLPFTAFISYRTY